MIQTAIRLKTHVLPGKRVEFTNPTLDEGQEVELIVLQPEKEEKPPASPSLLQFIQNIPPGPRPFATWEEYERALQEEKEAWER